MNANSSNDEPKTEPDTLQDMSEGARMLIERMKTHPEEFEQDGRFSSILDWHPRMSARDKQAISKAHDVLIKEPKFTETIFSIIFNPEQEPKVMFKAKNRYSPTYSSLFGQRDDLRVTHEGQTSTIHNLSANQTVLQKIKSIIT
jgi:hypothetical protein